uniref:Uncharacterized protein n=1 Tax=Quercus lobata TaxID=97700 RepID=A0A7N2R5Q5_QUELO
MNGEEEEDEFVASSATWRLEKEVVVSSEYLSPAENPLVSKRFNHRKLAKASRKGQSQRCKSIESSKAKTARDIGEHWKAITEGRAMPLKTFKDRTNQAAPEASAMSVGPGPGPGKGKPHLLRKEPSLSQDELNWRVEAFIKKFNEEMRLQGQEAKSQ